jgi:hypothetical protein
MPTVTPNYGWPVPLSTDYVKDGASAIEALGDAIDATVFGLGSGALALVKSQVIGTAVSTVAVTGAFSSTYRNYKVIISGGSISGAGNPVSIQLGPSSVGAYNTSYYMNFIYNNYSSNSVAGAVSNNTSAWTQMLYPGSNGYHAEFELLSPQAAYRTGLKGTRFDLASAGIAGPITGFHDSVNQFTDFSLLPTGGNTLTGGTIYVYGYKV